MITDSRCLTSRRQIPATDRDVEWQDFDVGNMQNGTTIFLFPSHFSTKNTANDLLHNNPPHFD